MTFLVRLTVFIILVFILKPDSAYAACAAGIPCVTYAVDTGANDEKRGDAETCDGDFMNQIYARAFMNAQRENLMNQRYIRKADSVLEYSCFEQFANLVSVHAAPLFSETAEFDGRTVPLNIRYAAAADGTPWNNPPSVDLVVNMGAGHILPRMQSMVHEPLQEYINGSFSHDYLGGTMTGVDYVPNPSAASYSCGYMNMVFLVSKCVNLDRDGDAVDFPEFVDLVSTDPREFPAVCGTGTEITTQLIDVSENVAPTYNYATFDPVVVHWEMFEIEATGFSSDTCPAPPIPTGLTMQYYEGTAGAPSATNLSGYTPASRPVEEFICPNPGCIYLESTGDCEM